MKSLSQTPDGIPPSTKNSERATFEIFVCGNRMQSNYDKNQETSS